jgi:hypothetical protein
MAGVKKFETRSWPVPRSLIGERIAIHAAKRTTKAEEEFWMDVVLDRSGNREVYAEAFAKIGVNKWSDLPRGAIVGYATIAASNLTQDVTNKITEIEAEWGNYSQGRWAWLLTNIDPIAPVPCIGRQGFFDYTP